MLLLKLLLYDIKKFVIVWLEMEKVLNCFFLTYRGACKGNLQQVPDSVWMWGRSSQRGGAAHHHHS